MKLQFEVWVLLCVLFSSLTDIAKAAEPSTIYRVGEKFFGTRTAAEAELKLNTVNGQYLQFNRKETVNGQEQLVYRLGPSRFTRLPIKKFAGGTWFVRWTEYSDEPLDAFGNGPCAAIVKPTVQMGAVTGDVISFGPTTPSSFLAVPGYLNYVREVIAATYSDHGYADWDGNGAPYCKLMDSRSDYSFRMDQPIECPQGYRPWAVVVPGVIFTDVCIALDSTDYFVYLENETCPVEPLTAIELITPNDAASLAKTLALERGEDAYDLLSENMRTAERCLAAKFTAKGACYSLESTYRSSAYQTHLREIYDKWLALQKEENQTPRVAAACEPVKQVIDAEMGGTNGEPGKMPCNIGGGRNHCIRFPPATTDPKHTSGDAVDIASDCVAQLKKALGQRLTLSNYIDQAPSCNVTWGGSWTPPDSVHFKYETPVTPTPVNAER